MKLAFFLLFFGLAAAVPSNSDLRRRASQKPTPDQVTRRLLIGAPNKIIIADFLGNDFTVNKSMVVDQMVPSWLLFKEPDLIYFADEKSGSRYILQYNPTQNEKIIIADRKDGAKGCHPPRDE